MSQEAGNNVSRGNSLSVPKSCFPARGSQQVISGGRSTSVCVPCSPPLVPPIIRPQSSRSAGSKPGSARKKVGLQPGHSLMDWIRLTKSGKDLSGTNGKLTSVSPEELALHNTESDCWIAFRGLVYNVTPYMDFHPGGAEELMRAAGGDGTELFDKVHQWVNLESMMASTIVGKLVKSILPKDTSPTPPSKTRDSETPEKKVGSLLPPPPLTPSFTSLVPPDAHLEKRSSSVATTSSSTPSISVVDSVEHIRVDWFQNGLKLVLVIFTPSLKASIWGSPMQTLSPSNFVITKNGLDFHVDVILDEGVSVLEWRLHDSLDDDVNYEFKYKPGGSKVEIILKKKNNVHWTSFGTPSPQHMSFNLVPNPDHFWRLKLESISIHTHNTFLLVGRIPWRNFLTPPPGAHVFLRRTIVVDDKDDDDDDDDGKLVSRPYTPLHPYFGDGKMKDHDGTSLSFLIKSYEYGEFTKSLDTLRSGDKIEIGVGFHGNIFRGLHAFPDECARVCMLAAGTGITPMTGIIHELLLCSSASSSSSSSSLVVDSLHLIFFNRTRRDILLSSSWERIEDAHPKRFRLDHVLSNADDTWTGRKGHVNKELLEGILQGYGSPKEEFDSILLSFVFVVCGSPEFNMAAESALEALGVEESKVHVFA